MKWDSLTAWRAYLPHPCPLPPREHQWRGALEPTRGGRPKSCPEVGTLLGISHSLRWYRGVTGECNAEFQHRRTIKKFSTAAYIGLWSNAFSRVIRAKE